MPSPDPKAGLYVRARGGEVVHVRLPPGCLAFQMGEATQIHSGGALVATPHCVRAAQGPAAVGVARNQFAVFIQPNFDEPMVRLVSRPLALSIRTSFYTCLLALRIPQFDRHRLLSAPFAVRTVRPFLVRTHLRASPPQTSGWSSGRRGSTLGSLRGSQSSGSRTSDREEEWRVAD